MAVRAMPSHNGAPKPAQSLGAPNQTLYCTNLPDKLQKQDLRLSLYTLFSTYGPVLDVVALKTMKMRGQAHIVYRDVQASTQALRALQGFGFFGKEMVPSLHVVEARFMVLTDPMRLQKIQYAKGKSDTIAKLDGTYHMPIVAAGAVTSTELQQSIFNAPPSSTSAPPPTAAGSLKPPDTAANGVQSDAEGVQGVKRRREDESDADDAPMEEDDSDAPMEASSDEG